MQKKTHSATRVLETSRSLTATTSALVAHTGEPGQSVVPFGQALSHALAMGQDTRPGFCCKLMEPAIISHPGQADQARTLPERRYVAVELKLGALPQSGRNIAARETYLPPLIMLYPGNSLLLQFPLEVLENTVARAKLAKLFGWIEAQRDLSTDRYSPLWRIRGFPLFYGKVKEMALKETRLLKHYRGGWDQAHGCARLTFREQSDLELFYARMLLAGICIMDRLLAVIASVQPPLVAETPLPALGDMSGELETICRELNGMSEHLAEVSRLRMKAAVPGLTR